MMGDSNDPDDPSFVIYYPGLCHYLEEYGYWWYFWDCANRTAEAERTIEGPACDLTETVTLTPHPSGGVLTTITRGDKTIQRVTFPHRSKKVQS